MGTPVYAPPVEPHVQSTVPVDAVSVRDLEAYARERLPEPIWNYVAGGAADETSLGWNEQAWRDLRLAPQLPP